MGIQSRIQQAKKCCMICKQQTKKIVKTRFLQTQKIIIPGRLTPNATNAVGILLCPISAFSLTN